MVLGLALVAPPALARGERRRVAGYQQIELKDMLGNPSAFVGKRVSFDAFFAGLGRIYLPFQTPFVVDTHLNFRVWPPGTRLWDAEARKDAYLFLFVPREEERIANYVMRRKLYEAVRLHGKVVVVHDEKPWFEIEDIEPSPEGSFTDLALKHILVGIKSLKGKDFDMARESFEEALREGLPKRAHSFAQRELGGTYFELGLHKEAAEALTEAMKLTGKEDAWINLRLGQSVSRAADKEEKEKLRKKRLETAKRHLDRARRLDPSDPEVYAEMGWVLAKLGEPREGLKKCRVALGMRQSAAAYRIQAKIYLQINKFPQAENSYQRAILLDASNPVYHKEFADIYTRAGKLDLAEAEYTNVIMLAPTEPEGYILRAKVRRARGNLDGAIEDYGAALRQDTENLEALLGTAAVYVKKAQFDAARRILEQAEALAPKSVDVMVMKAEVLSAQGAYEECVRAYRDILKGHPKAANPKLHYGLGMALWKQKKSDLRGASKELTTAVRLDSDFLEARTALAEVYMDLGRFPLAVRELAAVKARAPGRLRSRLLLAQAMAENKDTKGALSELAKLVRERPDSVHAKNNRAYLLLEFGGPGDRLEATELAQAAYESNPANPVFQDTLGWAKYRGGDTEGARILLEQAVIRADSPEPFYHLAAAAREDGEIDPAKENVTECLRRLNVVTAPGYVTRLLLGRAQKLAREVGAPLRPAPREAPE